MRASVVVAVLAVLVGSYAFAGPVRYTIDATLDPRARTIGGTVEVRLVNTTGAALGDVALVLYPNRFRDDPGVNDLNRQFVHPREELVPGGLEIGELTAANGETLAIVLAPAGGWRDVLARAVLPTPLAPGAATTVRARFRTRLPERFGPFGTADGRVTALGGWFPTLATAGPGGRWEVGVPGRASVRGRLRVPRDHTVVVGHSVVPAGHDGVVSLALDPGEPPYLLASDDYEIAERPVDGGTIRAAILPLRASMAVPRRRPRADVLLDTIARIVAERPAGVPAPGEGLVVVEAPLRWELVAPSAPGIAVVSDRTLRVHRLLGDLHERALAEAVYAALLAGEVDARESPADAPWVLEGIGATLADRYLAAAHPRRRTVAEWIGLFDVFAIVDRFASEPKVPFRDVFYPEAPRADDLRDGLETFVRDRPPGRTILAKLRAAFGDDTVEEAVTVYLTGKGTLRAVVAERAGAPVDPVLDQWIAPYPTLRYALADVRLNAAGAGGEWRHRIDVERRASRRIREPVTVEVQGRRAERARFVWDDGRDRTRLDVTTPWPARAVVLDPEARLLEDGRAEHRSPLEPQLVLDSADVTVTSSELGAAALFVLRERHDYTRDVGLVGFFDNRAVGMHVGPRLHFGPPNDRVRYRHNLFAFYTLSSLRGDFTDESRPAFRTDGTLAGLGVRYDWDDELAFDNPTSVTKLRLFGDWFTGALGSSFDFVQGGVRVSAVRPLWTHRTLLAGQVLNGFSAPLDGPRVPNQGRFSLGGDLAIRGIAVDDELGENIVLARLELRQTVYPEVDLNLADLAVLRHGQFRFFVDTGKVDDRRGSLYRVSDLAVGVGVGAATMYEFMGFHPGVAYVAIAQRVDRFDGVDNDVQFLFGTRQAF